MTPKTVAIADKTTYVRDRFSVALKEAGYKIIALNSEADLFECLRARAAAVDLLVLDLRLTTSTSANLVRLIRNFDRKRLPILVLSGSVSHAGEVRELAELGVAGYINEHSTVQRIVPSLTPHLFPDSFDRRTSTRVGLSIPLSYRFDNTIVSALTLNLSKSGLGVRTMSPLDTGSEVEALFRPPGAHRDVETTCRVAWSDRRIGMGLQFEQINSADQVIVDEFVDQYLSGDET